MRKPDDDLDASRGMNGHRRRVPLRVSGSEASQTAFERHVLPEIEVLLRVARSLTHNDADAEIERALAELDEPFRRVIELVDIEGLSYAEAAEVLGVPTGTIMSRLHRARGRIRDHLARAGIAPRSH